MRVTSNSFPTSLLADIQRLTVRMNTQQQQASTGQRVAVASDDPAAAVRILNNQSDQTRIAQYQRNASHANDLLTASSSQIQNLLKISDRGNEIVSTVNDVIGSNAIKTYGSEINQLLEQGLVNANSSFNGEPLFGGTTANAQPFTATRDANGNITAISYAGANNTAQVQVAEGSSVSPYTSPQENRQISDFLNKLVSLRDALNTGTTASVHAQSATLQTSENDLINMVSGHGAMSARLNVDMSQNDARYSDLAGQVSRDGDADLAQTIVALNQSQNAYQAALMSAGKVLNKSLLDYLP